MFRQAWTPETKTFDYIDCLFYAEASAIEEMKRQIRDASSSDGRTTRPGQYLDDGHTWRFDDDHELIYIGKVNVRL